MMNFYQTSFSFPGQFNVKSKFIDTFSVVGGMIVLY